MPDDRVGEAARVRLFGLADPLGQFVQVNGRRSSVDRSRTTRSLRQPGAYDQSWQIQRNASLPRYNFRIDPETLHGFLDLFETPTDHEGADLVVVPHSTQPGNGTAAGPLARAAPTSSGSS
jgi:hypothetical protein